MTDTNKSIAKSVALKGATHLMKDKFEIIIGFVCYKIILTDLLNYFGEEKYKEYQKYI